MPNNFRYNFSFLQNPFDFLSGCDSIAQHATSTQQSYILIQKVKTLDSSGLQQIGQEISINFHATFRDYMKT